MQTQLKAYDYKKSALNILLAILILIFAFCFKRLDGWQREACYKYKDQLSAFTSSKSNKDIADFHIELAMANKQPLFLSKSCILSWGLDYKNESLDRSEIVMSRYNGERSRLRRDILGRDYKEIIRSFIERINWYQSETSNFAKGEKRFSQIGLWDKQWQEAHDNVYYDFQGHRLYIRPEEGYVFKIRTKTGSWRLLSSASNWELIYNIKKMKWYFRIEDENEEVEYDSLLKIRIEDEV